MEGADFAHAFQLLVDDLHEDAVAFAVEDAHLLLAEEDGLVEELVQQVEGFLGAVAAEVEVGLKWARFSFISS